MTIKDIIKSASLLMGRMEIYSALDGTQKDEEVTKLVDMMTGLANLVINELSRTYIPLVKEEKLSATNGRISYEKFTETPVRIKEVFNSGGLRIAFKDEPTYLECGENEITVIYEFTPGDYALTDTIGYTEKQVGKRILAYGLCAEFSIAEGRFNEAVTWHKRYVDALSEICLPENSYIKARRFM